MSRQLTHSAMIAVLAMAMFAWSANGDGDDHPGGPKLAGQPLLLDGIAGR